GDGVERHARHRIEAGEGHEHRRQHDQEDVAGRPADHRRDHGTGSLRSAVSGATGLSAGRGLLSASIREGAVRTSSSPALTPPRTSRNPSRRRQSVAGRGSKRPSPFATSTTWRAPLSITALSGTATTGAASPPARKRTSAYMSVLKSPCGLATAMRT